MTNKQAVEILNRIRCSIHEDSIEEQALVYAIDALEGKGTNVPSNSTISRTAAIDAVEFGITYAKAIDVNTGESKELFKEGNDALKKAVERLKELPSAEPKTPSNGSITRINPENTHDRTMGDLIRRQEAKDAIDMALDHIDHVPPWVYDKLLNALNEVPSAEKAQLSEEDATKDATSDLISKKEATTIPVMPKEHREYQTMNLDDAYEQGWFDYQKCIEELPSAEPEIIRCRDCKHHDGIRCFRWNSTIITGFDDYCSNAERRGEEE